MANVTINENHLTNIAEAIRYKNGTENVYKPRDMASAIRAISTSSTDAGDELKEFIERSLEGEVTVDCDSFGLYSFAYSYNLTAINSSTALKVDRYAFCNCKNLYSINLPNVTTIGNYGFLHCDSLGYVNLPSVTDIGTQGINSDNLRTLELPSIQYLRTAAIDCSNLEKIDLGSNLREVYYSCLADCETVTAIIIRKNSVPKSVDASSPFPTHFKTSYTGDLTPGYIYVPAAVIEDYRNFEYTYDRYGYAHWANYNYRAIEDYPEICG